MTYLNETLATPWQPKNRHIVADDLEPLCELLIHLAEQDGAGDNHWRYRAGTA